MKLSPYQQAIKDAVTKGKGDLVIEATAGSGKTTTATMCAELVKSGKVLFLAFNKHIAEELERRLPDVKCKTIHAVGYGLLATTLRGKLIVKGNKYSAMARECVQARFKPDEFREAYDCVKSLVDFSRLTLTDLSIVADVDHMVNQFHIEGMDGPQKKKYIKSAKDILARGIEMAEKLREVDYTDQLWLPYVKNIKPRMLYDAVIIDEAQDLSQAQLELVLRLRAPGGRMFFFGDRRQAIQGFAGANTDSIDRIIARTRAKTLPLSISYRLPVSHVELAKKIEPRIEPAPSAVPGEIAEISPNDLAEKVQVGDLVICRRTSPLIDACLKIIASGRPARVKGRDVAAKLIDTIQEISEMAGFRYDCFSPFLDKWTAGKIGKLMQRGMDEAEPFIEQVRDIATCVETCWYNFNHSSISELRTKIEEIFSDDRAMIMLSTIHRAKGLEADRVFILEYERLPYKWKKMNEQDRIQESNIHFVGLTRARQSLFQVFSDKEGVRRREAAGLQRIEVIAPIAEK